MDTGHSERERFPLLLLRDGEPGFADHVGEALRLGELADRLDEVLLAALLRCWPLLTHPGDAGRGAERED